MGCYCCRLHILGVQLYEQIGQGHHCCASHRFQWASLRDTRLQLQCKLTRVNHNKLDTDQHWKNLPESKSQFNYEATISKYTHLKLNPSKISYLILLSQHRVLSHNQMWTRVSPRLYKSPFIPLLTLGSTAID